MDRTFWDSLAVEFERSSFQKLYSIERLKRFLRRILPFSLRGKRILDVGTGTGVVARAIAGIGGDKVVALDISMAMLKVAGRKGKSFTRIQGDGLKLPFKSSSFDLVVSRNYLSVLDDVKAASIEMGRVLKKGGFMLLMEGYYSIFGTGRNRFKDALEGLMEAGIEPFVEKGIDGEICLLVFKKILVPFWKTDLILGYKLR